MSDVAARRLAEERKNWRKDHPPGFFARPERAADGTVDLFRWKCVVPGAKDTAWAGDSLCFKAGESTSKQRNEGLAEGNDSQGDIS